MQPEKAVPIRQGIDLKVSHTAGDQPAVMFLHGGLGNRFNWRSQFEFAQIQGWQALAYDLARRTRPAQRTGRALRENHPSGSTLCRRRRSTIAKAHGSQGALVLGQSPGLR